MQQFLPRAVDNAGLGAAKWHARGRDYCETGQTKKAAEYLHKFRRWLAVAIEEVAV